MPPTDPFHSLAPGRKLTDAELARSIRVNMEAELDAINLYAAHVEATDSEEAKAILRHVMDEEKEHLALFTELIYRLDPEQRQHSAEATRKYQLIVGGAPKEAVEAIGEGQETTPAELTHSKTFTVGSLSRR